MNIISVPDPRLFQKSEEVRFPLSLSDRTLISNMIAICQGTRENSKKLVGLAAPQLGILRRIIIVDFAADGTGKVAESNLRVMINPEVFPRAEVMPTEGPEGCGSIPGVAGIVARPLTIGMAWLTKDGDRECGTVMGYKARIAQHEVDHLDGILFPDRMASGALLHELQDEEYPVYRKEWRTWNRFMPEQWWRDVKAQAGQ